MSAFMLTEHWDIIIAAIILLNQLAYILAMTNIRKIF